MLVMPFTVLVEASFDREMENGNTGEGVPRKGMVGLKVKVGL